MSIMDSGIFKLLDDIRISSERILAILESQTKESFLDADASWTAQDIIARRLSIIGEAAASLSRKYPDFCEKHPEIPFLFMIMARLTGCLSGIRYNRIFRRCLPMFPV